MFVKFLFNLGLGLGVGQLLGELVVLRGEGSDLKHFFWNFERRKIENLNEILPKIKMFDAISDFLRSHPGFSKNSHLAKYPKSLFAKFVRRKT